MTEGCRERGDAGGSEGSSIYMQSAVRGRSGNMHKRSQTLFNFLFLKTFPHIYYLSAERRSLDAETSTRGGSVRACLLAPTPPPPPPPPFVSLYEGRTVRFSRPSAPKFTYLTRFSWELGAFTGVVL